MRSGHAAGYSLPVVAAGVGVRRGNGWAVRSASFRLGPPGLGPAPLAPPILGIATFDAGHARHAIGAGVPGSRWWAARQRAADEVSHILTAVLAGRNTHSYGSLIVLGQDLSEPGGRAAVRLQVGLARGRGLTFPGVRIRGLVDQAAWRARQLHRERYLLVAAILDRLALTAWAGVPLRAAPPLVARKARLAAAMVNQPRLLLLDGMLDDLGPADQIALGAVIRDLARDTSVIAAGRDAVALRQASEHVLTLSEGILVGPPPPRLGGFLTGIPDEPAYFA